MLKKLLNIFSSKKEVVQPEPAKKTFRKVSAEKLQKGFVLSNGDVVASVERSIRNRKLGRYEVRVHIKGKSAHFYNHNDLVEVQ